jgi:hypothetical protein
MLQCQSPARVSETMLRHRTQTMEGIVFDVSALRRDYRDSISQLSNTAVHRKNVDNDMVNVVEGSFDSAKIIVISGCRLGRDI